MPERLLSVISGILAGGIPGFRFELCCFSPSYLALFCVSLSSLFCFSSVASHYDTQVVSMHVVPLLVQSHSSVSVWLGLVVVLCFFVCLFASFFVRFVFDGIAHWTLYRSITSSFEAADLFDGLAIYNSALLLRLNVCI